MGNRRNKTGDVVALDDVASINNETLSEKSSPDLVIRYIDLSSVSGPNGSPKPELMKFGNAPSRARRKVQKGDILVSTVRPYLRGFTRIADSGSDLVASTGFAVVRPNDPDDEAYIFQQILSDHFMNWVKLKMTGSNYPAVSATDVAEFRFRYPEKRYRTKIAEILTAVDEAIECTRAVISQTRRLKSALLENLFGAPKSKTKIKTRIVLMGQLVPSRYPICYGILKPGRGYPGGVPVVKVKNLVGGRVDTSDLLLTSPEIDNAYRRSRLKVGDILLSIRGTTGRVAIVPPELDRGNITQDTARLSFEDDHLRDYVYYALQGKNSQKFIAHHTIGQAVKGINIADVRKIPIPIPDQSEIERVVELFHTCEDQLNSNINHNKGLAQFKSALSQGLLTGCNPVSTRGVANA